MQNLANFMSGGALTGILLHGGAGGAAVGVTAGTVAMGWAYGAMPLIRTKYWPEAKPMVVDMLKSAGVDYGSLTTGGTPQKKKK